MSAWHLKKLESAAPGLLATLCAKANSDPALWPSKRQAALFRETLWALSQSETLGHLYALGLVRLEDKVCRDHINRYREVVHTAMHQGLTLAQMMAEHFPPVLLTEKTDLIKKFQQAVDTLLSKGTYTLKPPLEGLSRLLSQGQTRAADAFLELLIQTFSQAISYNLSLKFSYLLPQAVHAFDPSKTHFQIDQLTRVVNADPVLAERFLAGLEKGLGELDQHALANFVTCGLNQNSEHVALGRQFLSLTSQLSQLAFEEMQVSVGLARVRPLIESSINVRLGYVAPIRAVTEVAALIRPKGDASGCYACSDGRNIYLPEKISDFDSKRSNTLLYKILAKLEAAALEFGSFDFDLERFAALCNPSPALERVSDSTDFEVFFNAFDLPELARDLFSIIEMGRLRHRLNANYTGFARRAFAFLQAQHSLESTCGESLLQPLYAAIALGRDTPWGDRFAPMIALCNQVLCEDVPVEISAVLTQHCYDGISDQFTLSKPAEKMDYTAFLPRYSWNIQPALLKLSWALYQPTAARIKERFSVKGVDIYAADIRRHLQRHNGILSIEDLKRIILSYQPRNNDCDGPCNGVDFSGLNLSPGSDPTDTVSSADAHTAAHIRRYKEWDLRISDYKRAHVRVVDQIISAADSHFYSKTLSNKAGLVARMRKAFELLKPERMMRLRKWVEGDDFDYRALIDFALDKKAGIMPSDRLYIKRVKQNRDVAVLLLVDISRSTANLAAGAQRSILAVQKEAIVLFCEALQVVGDAFAIAGFSGSGRLNVDYFRIKDFNESLSERVKQRIGAISSQRSTRMGAAVRRAVSDLERSAQKVRLMLVLSDGFPNDADYKGDYAVVDTRTAISEARAKNIVVKAITVNMGADVRLNELYGRTHHHVIEDVGDLPDQLLDMYGKLTRM